MLLRGQLKTAGYQWRLIEDKKILSFCNNEEFLSDPNNPVSVLEKKEENINKEIKEETNENEEDKKEEKNENKEIKIVKDEKELKEKDEMIELLKTNMKTERELLQLIIDELNEKLDKKEKENMQLLMTISQLKQSLESKNIQNTVSPSQDTNKIPEPNNDIKNEETKKEVDIINNEKENTNISIPTGISFDLSQFEKEKNELQFEIEKKNSEIKQIQKEKEQIEEQNIFTSKENHQLRQKISELNLQIEILKTSSSSSSLYSLKEDQDYDFKKKLPHRNRDKTPESKKSSQIRNTFGVTLKKVSGGKGNVDYILQAQEENIRRQKDAEILFKNSELYKSLHKNVVDYDSPCTVSSNSDILEIDMPELNFANNNNDEQFKKIEEELYSKEMQHLKEKKKKQINA